MTSSSPSLKSQSPLSRASRKAPEYAEWLMRSAYGTIAKRSPTRRLRRRMAREKSMVNAQIQRS